MPRKPKTEVEADSRGNLFFGILGYGWAALQYPKFKMFDFMGRRYMEKPRLKDDEKWGGRWWPVSTWMVGRRLTKDDLNIRKKK